MQKIRINDLARELEVKSKSILDALQAVGVTEKKTHSSSLEIDEAEKVRGYFRAQAEAQAASSKPSRSARADDTIKTKIDLSHISKPGDVLKAIGKQQTPAATPTPVKPPAPAAPAVESKPVVAPPRPAVAPTAASHPPAAPISIPAPPAVQATPPPVAAPPTASTQAQPVAAASPQSGVPIAPRRMIVPQTGPRPVYKAPIANRPQAPAAPMATSPVQQTRPAESRPMAGRPIASRPGAPGRSAPGRPVPGQPIFQRPRPSGPMTSRSPLRPGERRPMHPTRQSPTGVRPMGVGPGAPPTSVRPGARPSGPSRRPGQRYVPRGVKEGPMKGFVPPPRLSLSTEPLPITRAITIAEGISVKDLAEKLEIRAKDLIARLLARGVFATINQSLDSELAIEMARHFGAETSVITFEEQAAKEATAEAATGKEVARQGVVARPPVVTIMGHVDHGKTTLLDSIRETNVAGGEAGGITQHIGAYKVRVQDKESPAYGREIVFLDTPGHEAFTRMRARGAKATDIVVLVVAADDGVMPQTLEAMDHAKAADVPIIVAVNKIDKPDALPDRVKKQLADRGLMPENWGGSTVFVDVSAKQKTNLNLLLEMVALVADLKELKANPERSASGVVLEAKLDRGRGPVATVLVQDGTLRVGDNFVVGNMYGKVRAMFDDRSNALDEAPPSTPVEILGLEGLPQAGDQFVVVADREKARGVSEYREQKAREAQLAKSSRVSLEGLAEQLKTAGSKELFIILKGDVQGSVEVLSDLLGKLSNDKVRIKVLRTGVGAITESDVLLASASNAIIIGFNVRPERKAQELAEQEKVDIRLHSIIYELQDEIKKAMSGLLEPTIKENYQGRAEVRETFRIPKVGTVAGCQVIDGTIKRDSEVRLLRDNVVVFKGKIGSLRRFKDDVSEVRNGMECGINIANYGDVKKGDVIEAFVTEHIAAEVIA
ncbi:MAG TPA: translation initiation factor IF-2 [Terriglobales bacterium]|nr:translation initiation factor IF-2 [Terriglobales bacterium]